MNRPVSVLLGSCLAGMITACGDSSVSSDVSGRSGMDSTRLTLKITDAPLDSVSEVWVQFTAIELRPTDEDTELLHFDLNGPQTINLLSLTGARAAILLDNVVIPAGDYDWIRLRVNAVDNIVDSYVLLPDGSMPELSIPSGSQTGIQLNRGFTAESATPAHLLIDFDLRKSLVITGAGDYVLNPVLNLVDESITGTITGTIDDDLLVDDDCSDADPSTGNAVYVFAGNNIAPDDIDNMRPEPYTTSTISFDTDSGEYQYEIGFLPEGKYTLAFTCEADNDQLDTDDDISFSSIRNNVNVTHTEEYSNNFR